MEVPLLLLPRLQGSEAAPELTAFGQPLVSYCYAVLITIPVSGRVGDLSTAWTLVLSVQECTSQLLNPSASLDSGTGSSSSRQAPLPRAFKGLVRPGLPEEVNLRRRSGQNACKIYASKVHGAQLWQVSRAHR